MKPFVILAFTISTFSTLLFSQQRVTQGEFRPRPLPDSNAQAIQGVRHSQELDARSDNAGGSQTLTPDYTLGPGDLLTLSEANLDESGIYADKTFRVDNGGDVTFPLAGRVHVSGLTTTQLALEVNQRLLKVVKDPQAVVGVAEFHSQPVSVLGAVNIPGVFQISGSKNLFEVLSLAGGLRPDSGNSVMITRSLASGSLPLANAKPDVTGQYSVASVRVKTIMSATDPSQNIAVRAEDVITVPKGEVVYAVGALTKPGGFLLGESGSLSALQVISLAEGLLKTASAGRAEILRVVPGSPGRIEITINAKEMLTGKVPDVPLQPDDILFIPSSGAKAVGFKTIDAIVSAATGIAIYGRY